MQNLIIREMKIEDIESVYDVEKNTFKKPWSKGSFYQELENKNAYYLVLEFEKEIIGYLGIWIVLDESHITNIAIKKEYQGRGFSKKLIEQLIKELKTRRVRTITLEVRKSNLIAQKLYKAFDFKVIGVRANYYTDNNEDAYLMKKETFID